MTPPDATTMQSASAFDGFDASNPPVAASHTPDTRTTSYPAALARSMRLAVHMLYGLVLACIYPLLGLRARQRLMRYWSRALLSILHIHLEISGTPPWRTRGILLVANHISWLDVFAINAANPSCFVAKSEVGAWPVIGWLCRLTRTIFIKREIRRDTLRGNREISQALGQGECVALFPEGTSTDGSTVRHFHSPLLQCGIDSGAGIQPVAIRYHDASGVRSNAANFIDDMSLLQSLRNILLCADLHVTVTFLAQIPCNGKNRRTLAGEAHAAISELLAMLDAAPARSYGEFPDVPGYPEPASHSMYFLLLDSALSRARQRMRS